MSDSDKIERRLRRLDAAVLHTKRRIETLSVVCERYHNIVAGAVISAEVSREQFTTAAQIAFRDPYRALKAWERREWRMANLLLEAPDEADAPGQVLAVIKVGKGGAGLSLRGQNGSAAKMPTGLPPTRRFQACAMPEQNGSGPCVGRKPFPRRSTALGGGSAR